MRPQSLSFCSMGFVNPAELICLVSGQGVWHFISAVPDKIIGAAPLSGYTSIPGGLCPLLEPQSNVWW